MGKMTLRELYLAQGIPRRAVQGYEKHGLIRPSGRNDRGHLLYSESTQARIAEIRQFQRFGFTLREIEKLIDAPASTVVMALVRAIAVMEQEQEDKAQAITQAQAKLKQLQEQITTQEDETEETT